MKRTNNKGFFTKVGEWIKAHKIWSIIIALVVIGGAFAVDSSTDTSPNTQTSTASQKEEKGTKHHKEEKAPEKAKGQADKPKEVKEEIETTEFKEEKGLSDDFRNQTQQYFSALADSYMTMGELETATSESEMMAIIKEGQSEYDSARMYYENLEANSDKEKSVKEKLSKIDGLTSLAFMNVETGLENNDVELINSATDDILEAHKTLEEVESEVK